MADNFAFGYPAQGNFAPSEEEKKQALLQSLMAAGLSMMAQGGRQAQPIGIGQAIGTAGLQGLSAYGGAMNNLLAQKRYEQEQGMKKQLQGAQIAEYESQVQARKNEAERSQRLIENMPSVVMQYGGIKTPNIGASVPTPQEKYNYSTPMEGLVALRNNINARNEYIAQLLRSGWSPDQVNAAQNYAGKVGTTADTISSLPATAMQDAVKVMMSPAKPHYISTAIEGKTRTLGEGVNKVIQQFYGEYDPIKNEYAKDDKGNILGKWHDTKISEGGKSGGRDPYTTASASTLKIEHEKATAAADALPKLDAMLAYREKNQTSPLVNSFGVLISKVAGTDPSGAAFNEILANTMAGSLRAKVIGPGSVSNYEQQILKSVSAGTMTPNDAAKKLLEHYRSLAVEQLNRYQTMRNNAINQGHEDAAIFTDFSPQIKAYAGKGISVGATNTAKKHKIEAVQ